MKITEQSCFYPDAYVYFDPATRGFHREDIWLEDRIHCWFIHPKALNEQKTLLVHLHGNAENMTSHITGALFLLDMGFPVLAFDYSGYGLSKGTPTLAGIQDDARLVFGHVFANPDRFGGSVFGFGQSMGAYTLARILPEFPGLSGAILEAGLYSFHALFCEAYPAIECTVPDEGYSALDTLPRSAVPKLFIHGTADGVVPYSHSVRMHEVASDPKELLILDGVGHIDAFISRHAVTYREKIREFISQRI
jgi:fermentation-respiration switch protein FrsA (DUF1100 family)